MTTIEVLANRTLELMPLVENVSSDYQDIVLTVSIVMIIIKLLVLAYQCWRTHKEPATIVWNPNVLQKLYMRRVVRKVLVANGMGDKTGQVMTALLRMAKAATIEDIQNVFDEAQSDPEIWATGAKLGLL